MNLNAADIEQYESIWKENQQWFLLNKVTLDVKQQIIIQSNKIQRP